MDNNKVVDNGISTPLETTFGSNENNTSFDTCTSNSSVKSTESSRARYIEEQLNLENSVELVAYLHRSNRQRLQVCHRLLLNQIPKSTTSSLEKVSSTRDATRKDLLTDCIRFVVAHCTVENKKYYEESENTIPSPKSEFSIMSEKWAMPKVADYGNDQIGQFIKAFDLYIEMAEITDSAKQAKLFRLSIASKEQWSSTAEACEKELRKVDNAGTVTPAKYEDLKNKVLKLHI